MSKVVLKAESLRLSYGSRIVVDDCSLEVTEGECVALVGANGAGKSTMLKSMVGIHGVKSGSIFFADRDVTGWSAGDSVSAGLVLCPEGRHLFPEMTVHDNLLLGMARGKGGRQDNQQRIEELQVLFPLLSERRDQLAGTMSGGEQQMVALGRALASRPKLLILDEPTLGLAPLMVDKVFEIVQTVVQSGVSVLIAEQNVTATLEVADRVYVMEAGRITHSGGSEQMKTDPRLTSALMGM